MNVKLIKFRQYLRLKIKLVFIIKTVHFFLNYKGHIVAIKLYAT
jgi:hypothetical protein